MATERETFMWHMGREGVPLRVAQAIMRNATTLERLAVKDCNEGLTEAEAMAQERARNRIVDALKDIGPNYQSFGVTFSGDPRGAVVKLKVPSGRTDDWGQTGLCVPTKVAS